MRNAIAFAIALTLVGCATLSGRDYAKVYDRKYNEYRVVEKESPGSFVGTSATKSPVRAPGQHP